MGARPRGAGRRWALVAAVCSAAGVGSAVALAWITAWRGLYVGGGTGSTVEVSYAGQGRGGWTIRRYSALAMSEVDLSFHSAHDDAPPQGQDLELRVGERLPAWVRVPTPIGHAETASWGYGLPFRCLALYKEYDPNGDGSGYDGWYLEPTKMAWEGPVVLPSHVIPAGMAADGAVFGLAWWGVLFGWRGVRRRLRRRGGRCAGCGYDLRGLADGRCPECGAVGAGPR